MFTPVSLKGKLFKKYLLGFSHPSKIRIQNILGRKFFVNGIPFKNAESIQFKLDANDWITRICLLEGDYESGSTNLAKKIMSEGGVFIDIGANFGLFTCQIANANKEIRVIAVEPNYKIIGRLLQNIHLNNLQDRVLVLNMAVSNKMQLLSLIQPVTDNLGTTQTVNGQIGELSILSCTLDFILEQNNLWKVNLLKIDIEGNEFEILANFPFEKYFIHNIIVEFNHLSKINFEQFKTFFESKNFKCFTIDGMVLTNANQAIPENNIWLVNQKKNDAV